MSELDNNLKNKKTKSEKILNVIGIVLLCIMGPILLIDIVYLAKTVINPDEVPSMFGSVPLVNMSDSMELANNNLEQRQNEARIALNDENFIWSNAKAINKHDLIFVKETNINEYLKTKNEADQEEVNKKLVGKVIAFKYPNKETGGWAVVIHKIAKVERASKYETTNESGWVLRTYGIHNPSVDNFTTDPNLIVGEYHGTRIAGVGAFVDFLQHWYGILIFIGVPIGAIIIYDVVVAKKQIRQDALKKTSELEAELEKLKAEKAALEEELKESDNNSNEMN